MPRCVKDALPSFPRSAHASLAPPLSQRLKLERRNAHPAAEIINRLVIYYNELRERSTTPARRAELCNEIMSRIDGRAEEICMRHDTTRVLQLVFKFGSLAQRSALFAELSSRVLNLTKEKYGHQTVEHMLRHGSLDIKEAIAAELKGHIAQLCTHARGSLVLEEGFTRGWSPATCWGLYQELYGKEFVHFKSEAKERNLGALLRAAPEKRKSVLDAAHFSLARMADKGLMSTYVAQRLLCEYFTHGLPEHCCAT
jgi:Pumilio-family RNA binding repeat